MVEPTELLLAHEHNRDALRRAHREGELERLRRGAYRRPPEQDDATARALDLVRAVDRQLRAPRVYSHLTAALLHGLPIWRRAEVVHVIQCSRASSRSATDIRRHVAPVPADHLTEVGGLPVCTLARTVADCALTLPPLEALVVADGARDRAGFDVDEALAWVRSQRRRNGQARAELVLDLSTAGVESPRETWLRYVALRAGLPRPQVQAPVRTRLGTFHCDLGWPEHGVYAEYDGLTKYRDDGVRPGHDGARELVAEKRRFDAIRETGVNPVRVTVKDAPDRVAARLSARFPDQLRRTWRVNPLLPPP
jgi:predicted transcriptional regulator of viral defense system